MPEYRHISFANSNKYTNYVPQCRICESIVPLTEALAHSRCRTYFRICQSEICVVLFIFLHTALCTGGLPDIEEVNV